MLDRRREPVRVVLVVKAAFRHFAGCCPDPIETGEPMARLSSHCYVHERCASKEVDHEPRRHRV